jgi:molybdopterin synthase sulfur carrier subunit
VKVTVKLFASYREMAGASEMLLELPEGATVRDALETLSRRHTSIGSQTYAPIAACNLIQVSPGHRLHEGDELAIFPPVSGG